jgi:hypothetical protein
MPIQAPLKMAPAVGRAFASGSISCVTCCLHSVDSEFTTFVRKRHLRITCKRSTYILYGQQHLTLYTCSSFSPKCSDVLLNEMNPLTVYTRSRESAASQIFLRDAHVLRSSKQRISSISDNIRLSISLVWCPGLNKKIAPLSFFHGCRKRRLKD